MCRAFRIIMAAFKACLSSTETGFGADGAQYVLHYGFWFLSQTTGDGLMAWKHEATCIPTEMLKSQ